MSVGRGEGKKKKKKIAISQKGLVTEVQEQSDIWIYTTTFEVFSCRMKHTSYTALIHLDKPSVASGR